MIPQLISILNDIPINPDTSHVRVKLKRLIRELEEDKTPTRAIPYPILLDDLEGRN